MEKYSKLRRKVADFSGENGNVIRFDSGKQIIYNGYYSKYDPKLDNPSLSDSDYDLLITGLTLNNSGQPISFVSNDKQIINLWRIIRKSEKIDPTCFRLYRRVEPDVFLFAGT
jgi:hypothetical protein